MTQIKNRGKLSFIENLIKLSSNKNDISEDNYNLSLKEWSYFTRNEALIQQYIEHLKQTL